MQEKQLEKGIGQRLKELRRALGLSQKEFGEKIGKTFRAIQNYEGEQRTPDETTLRLIEMLFNVNPGWLRYGRGEMFVNATKKEESIGARIKRLRHVLGLSQRQLAEELGMHIITISRYEREEWKPSSKFIDLLREKFKVNPLWLLTGEGNMFLGSENLLPNSLSLEALVESLTTEMLIEILAEKLFAESLQGEKIEDSLERRLKGYTLQRLRASCEMIKGELMLQLAILESSRKERFSTVCEQSDETNNQH